MTTIDSYVIDLYETKVADVTETIIKMRDAAQRALQQSQANFMKDQSDELDFLFVSWHRFVEDDKKDYHFAAIQRLRSLLQERFHCANEAVREVDEAILFRIRNYG